MVIKNVFSPIPGLLLVAIFCAAPSFASEKRVRDIGGNLSSVNTGQELESYTFSTRKGEVKSTIQCLGGYKFALAAAVGHSAAPESAVTIIQVHEDVKGRVVPAKC